MNGGPLRIGSRASALARVQAEAVAARLACEVAIVWIRSGGDADRTTRLTGFEGTGIFTAALHEALLDDRVDIAVHSLKDLPAGPEDGIALACVPPREDPRDVLVARHGLALRDLPPGARVGTGSPRRVAQLLRLRPDLVFVPVRGNVDTRLHKVRAGDLDAVVLALAGLRRLGREEAVTEILEPDVCLPAAGQGALGLTMRAGDARAETCVAPLRDGDATACTEAERRALHGLGAGCHTPVGALGGIEGGRVRLRVRLCALDGSRCLEAQAEGGAAGAAAVGEEAARILREQGADAILEASR